MDFSSGKKRMHFMNLWKLLKGAQHGCERAQQRHVEQLASPPAFSWRDVRQSDVNQPCCPSATCRLSLHCGSASNQSTDTVHFHRFYFVPLAHCIFYIWSLLETYTFPLGLTETSECLCTVYLLFSISLLYPSMVGDPEKQTEAQHCLETSAKTLL